MTAKPPLSTYDRVLAHQAAVRPEALALWFKGRETSFGQLWRHVCQAAHGYATLGLRPGDRVAVLAANSDLYLEAVHGAITGGFLPVPVNARLAVPEIAFIVADCGAKVLVTDAALLPQARAALEAMPAEASRLLLLGLDTEAADVRGYGALRDGQPETKPAHQPQPEDAHVVLYTSGTTANPKGVILSHYSALCWQDLILNPDDPEMGYWSPEDRHLACLPMFHVAGLGLANMAMLAGTPSYIAPSAAPEDLLSFMAEHRVTKAMIVPSLIHMLVEHAGGDRTPFAALDLVYYGAAPMPDAQYQRARVVMGCDLAQLYGLTESCGAITYLAPGDHDPGRPGATGKAMGHVDLKVVDLDGKALPPGEPGQICIRSPSLMTAYLNRPDATAKTLRDGWLYSGDMGRLEEDGMLFVMDRVDDMIITGGENVSPVEVENALAHHPGVAELGVIGVPDPKWGQAVTAYVVPRVGVDISEDGLRAFARERLAGYKVPKAVIFVDSLPRNASGKLLRRKLRAPD